MAHLNLIKELAPTLRHIYLFRSPVKSIHSFIKVYKAMPFVFEELTGRKSFLSTHFPLSHLHSHRNYPGMILSETLSRNEAIALMILSSLRCARDYVESYGSFAGMFSYDMEHR